MIGILVCPNCGARWLWPGAAPEPDEVLRCTDCRGPVTYERSTPRRPRYPFPLGASRGWRIDHLLAVLRRPEHTVWLRRLAHRELDALRRRVVSG